MKSVFKIDITHQYKSSRECFYLLLWIATAAIIFSIISNDINYQAIFWFALIFWFITAPLLALPFHLSYLKKNWNTKLIIDDNLQTLEIMQSGQSFIYNLTDIKVNRYILGHYKPGRTKSWIPIPFDYYGYLIVETKDKKEFYLTSLMLDPFNPPLKVDITFYELPFII